MMRWSKIFILTELFFKFLALLLLIAIASAENSIFIFINYFFIIVWALLFVIENQEKA